MGNCMETCSTRREEEETRSGGGREGDGGVQGKDDTFENGGGGVKFKILLTKGELERLLFQLREKGERRLEDVLAEMRLETGKAAGQAWKPTLESIMEVPEVQSFDSDSECLKLIPHKKFSFAKTWLLAAQFEIRQKNLKAARQILGNAIGMTPKDKIFKKYIEIELQLGNLDRCRILYKKYVEWAPANCYAWSKHAELEKSLSEIDRARAIFELAIAQPALDMPEVLWKAYIDFEMSEGELERTSQLYETQLGRTKHLSVWLSFPKFEASAGVVDGTGDSGMQPNDEDSQQMERVTRCRGVFEKAFNYFRTSAPQLKEERAMLLEEWLNMEKSFRNLGDVSIVQKKLPRKVKRKRAISSEDGTSAGAGYEEYLDYIFPDEVAMAPNLKILEAAYNWKKHKTGSDED